MSSAVANAIADSFSDQQIEQIANGTPQDIAKWVCETAAERGITVGRGPLENFAKAVSRLSDAETDLDHVEELLISLGRARVISSFQCGLLQIHYLR